MLASDAIAERLFRPYLCQQAVNVRRLHLAHKLLTDDRDNTDSAPMTEVSHAGVHLAFRVHWLGTAINKVSDRRMEIGLSAVVDYAALALRKSNNASTRCPLSTGG